MTTHSTLSVDLLYVRWFGRDPDWKGGPAIIRLDRIGWVPEDDPSGAFGFVESVDPSRVVRACHLIPAFALGKTTRLLRLSQTWDTLSGDWINYYVSRFVDRDTMMRYLGWGIGHRNPPEFSHEADSVMASTSDRELAQFGDPAGERRTEINKEVESDAASGEGDSDLDVISDREDGASDIDAAVVLVRHLNTDSPCHVTCAAQLDHLRSPFVHMPFAQPWYHPPSIALLGSS